MPSEQQKLTEFIGNRPASQEMLKDVLQEKLMLDRIADYIKG